MSGLNDFVAEAGYLVVLHLNNTIEIFDRQYKYISDDHDVLDLMRKNKVLVQTWNGYAGRDNKIGIGEWYQFPEEVRDKAPIHIK